MTNDFPGDSPSSGGEGFPAPEDIPQPGATPTPGGYPHQGEYPPPGGYRGEGLQPPPGSYPPADDAPVQYGVASNHRHFPSLRRSDAETPFRIRQLLKLSWRRFVGNAGAWLGFVVLAIIVTGLVAFPLSLVFYAPLESSTANPILAVSLAAAGTALFVLLGILVQSAMVNGALAESSGQRPSLREFVRVPNVAQVVLTAILVAAMTFLGTLLCIVPGLLAAFFSMFAVHFVIDRGQSAVEAIRSSWRVVGANVGPLLILVLVLYVVTVAGALTIIGMLVVVPFSMIAVAQAYRTVAR
ncbi:DUF2189 domain-containing protein [Lolliginicoccus suaedae]|uniref:hypothetical protein n=1 Tax=Lolliginicoccus suaedae TaxID=2605429 RepID=UPI0011EE214E|nr:hypothetical protein [Lolliginicoccus suaedae]